MSMLQDFYNFLAVYFQEGEPADAEALKDRMVQEGYEDVTAYDVREAVTLMYDEGDVFSNEQSSSLEAYTGGNVVDQSFNASDFGNVATGGTGASATTTGTATNSTDGGSSGGSAPAATAPSSAAPASTAPQPPPMDPKEGYSDLDAAVEQIVYVTNITNNTTNNNTTINDNDVFEDNDTIVDNSVNQTILADGDVTQTFDQDTISQTGDNSVANTGEITDSNVVGGDVDGVLADTIADSTVATGDVGGSVTGDITDSEVVGGDNSGIVGDVEGSAVVGDGNETTTLIDSDNNAVGDGALSIDGNNNAVGDGATTNQAIGDGNAVGDGSTAVNVDGENSGVIETGDGDVEAITNSDATGVSFGDGAGDTIGIADSEANGNAFGDGDATSIEIEGSTVQGSAIQTGDGGGASGNFDASTTTNTTTTTTTTTTEDNDVTNTTTVTEDNDTTTTTTTTTTTEDIDIVENNTIDATQADITGDVSIGGEGDGLVDDGAEAQEALLDG